MDWKVRRIVDNIWGPTGTILIHVAILVILVSCVSIQQREEEPEFTTIIREVEEPPPLEEIEQELKEIEDLPKPVDVVEVPTVSLDEEPPQMDAVAPDSQDVDFQMEQLNIMEAVSPLQIPGLFSNRMSAKARGDALGKFAGRYGKSTEYAVKRALNWLRDHQYSNGSWGPQYRIAMTGMALLTFLAHGETVSSPEYGEAVRKGLKYLLQQQRNGMFIGGGPVGNGYPADNRSQVQVYEHAIGTYAVSEAYGLTSIPYLKFAMEDAVQVILDGQHAAGSWDYGYRHGPEAQVDVSLAGWHIQALKAAYAAGAENPGIKAAIDSGVRGLKLMWSSSNNRFRYSTREQKPADNVMTGVAVLCMQLVGHAVDAEARAGLTSLKSVQFRWTKGDEPKTDERRVGEWPLYGWYYITQARFHQGGSTWRTWNDDFAPGICRMQNKDGSWCPAPHSVEDYFGPVYCTSLATLMLEVYYRLLPTYQEIEVNIEESMEQDEGEEEIVIKFG